MRQNVFRHQQKTVLPFRMRTKMNPRLWQCHTSKLRATCEFEQAAVSIVFISESW